LGGKKATSEITVCGITWPRAPHERIGALTPNEAAHARGGGRETKNRAGYDTFDPDWNNVHDRRRSVLAGNCI